MDDSSKDTQSTKVLGRASQYDENDTPSTKVMKQSALNQKQNTQAVWSVFLQRTTVHGLPLWNHAKGECTMKIWDNDNHTLKQKNILLHYDCTPVNEPWSFLLETDFQIHLRCKFPSHKICNNFH